MDPEANLLEQLDLASAIIEGADAVADADSMSEDLEASHDVVDDAERLAELVIALDEWIRRGGFLPLGWKKAREADLREQLDLARDILAVAEEVAEAESMSEDLKASHDVVDSAQHLADLVIAFDEGIRRGSLSNGVSR